MLNKMANRCREIINVNTSKRKFTTFLFDTQILFPLCFLRFLIFHSFLYFFLSVYFLFSLFISIQTIYYYYYYKEPVQNMPAKLVFCVRMYILPLLLQKPMKVMQHYIGTCSWRRCSDYNVLLIVLNMCDWLMETTGSSTNTK